MCRRTQSRLNRLPLVSYDPCGLVTELSVSRNRFDRHIKEAQTNMDVSGIGSVSGGVPTRAVSPITSVSQPSTASAVESPRDQLEISSAGKMLDRLSETPEVRADRLAQIKEAIENGAYDTDEKLEAALSKMIDSIGLSHDDE
jgi:anti-sigma28 factor (negative regulator of flagellin synthesis)